MGRYCVKALSETYGMFEVDEALSLHIYARHQRQGVQITDEDGWAIEVWFALHGSVSSAYLHAT
jgi:hypothetical protein